MRISDWSSDVCSSDLAPDLMQETFMRLLRSGAFDRIEHPTAYLMRSARNLLIERARRKAREQCIALPYDEERSEEHTSELQSLMRISYAVFCLKKKKNNK